MNRSEKALEVLRAGGYFRRQLETHYMGGMRMETRLRDAQHNVIKGVGITTFTELMRRGLLDFRQVPYTIFKPSDWVLARPKPQGFKPGNPINFSVSP